MKITDIRCFPVLMAERNRLLIKVTTDEGVYGWGESGLSTREKAVMGAVAHYREFLIGRDPMAIGALWQEMYRSQYFEGGRVLVAAISAIDIALHDIKGKALGVPVHALLGGKQRDRIGTFATTGAIPGPAMVDEALAFRAAGFDCIRLWPSEAEGQGRYEPRESIALNATACAMVRDAVGPSVTLGVDYHHRLSVAEAASFCQRMPRGTLDFLEEPLRAETPAAYTALRGLTETPFAIGEEWSSKWAALPFIEGDLAQFNRLDICNVGGFTEAMKIAGWSEAHYVDLMPHNPLGRICTAACIQLCAAVPNFAWLEWLGPEAEGTGAREDDLFAMAARRDGTGWIVPDAPGLGVEVDEAWLAKAAEGFTFVEAPHLRRGDGSFTNW
jgi:galactonate dehydratase